MLYKPKLKMDSTSDSFKHEESDMARTQMKLTGSNEMQQQDKPVYASKPSFAARNRSNPPIELQQTGENFSKTLNAPLEKIPLKDRIQRSDEKHTTMPQTLYLPGAEVPMRKFQIAQKQPEQNDGPMKLQAQGSLKIQQLPPAEPQQQSIRTLRPPTQDIVKPPLPQQSYNPSIGQQNKRDMATLGSKNALENKPAVASEQRVKEQLLEAEPIEDVELIMCPEGCGRQFKQEALEKHVKVCKQVFQQKRQEFNSKQMRIVEKDQQKFQRQGQIKEKQQSKSKVKQSDDPKWKKQSEELRQVIQKQKEKEQQQ